MAMTIKHYPEEERRALKEAHDLGEPKEWAVMDGSVIWGFFDTKEEAEAEIREIARDEKIGDRFSIWEDDIADEFDIGLDTVREIVKDRIP